MHCDLHSREQERIYAYQFAPRGEGRFYEEKLTDFFGMEPFFSLSFKESKKCFPAVVLNFERFL